MVDVDGVVVAQRGQRWDHDMEADLGISGETLQQAFFGPHFTDIVLGRADLHERLGPVLAQIAPHLTSDQLAAYWFSKDTGFDETLLDDLADVRGRGIELHLATVQEHHRARHLWTELGLAARFDAMHYAAAVGAAKPDAAFFRAVEARTGFAPSEVVLIDDSVRNVKSARACGWTAVLWTGEARLAEVLAAAGVDLPG
jgi:putative hydrolase of the HAD superfamily